MVIPKRGELSVGVHRRFVPAFGRTVNCQLAVGAFLSGDLGDLAVDWQLYLPRRWTEDARLRRQARIPEATGHATAAELCLALADQLARITPEMPPVVVHTDGHIDAGAVIAGLQARGLDWIVAVPDTLPLRLAASTGPHPADATTLHPSQTQTQFPAPEPAAELLRRHARPPTATPSPPGSTGSAPYRCCCRAGPGRPAGRRLDRLALTTRPALADQPAPGAAGRALAVIGSATAARAGAAEAELGLHDFAGRSYPGWHRHATLVSVASAHRRLGHEVCLRPNGD